MYFYQLQEWPNFTWDEPGIIRKLLEVRYRQGLLLGRIKGLTETLQAEANLKTLIADTLSSSEIEGEQLDADRIRSSISRRLGLGTTGLVSVVLPTEGVVEMILDATQEYAAFLSRERLLGWHAALSPAGLRGIHKIPSRGYRTNTRDNPMQVVSGPVGNEKVHFQAPDSELLEAEMRGLLHWFNKENRLDPIIKAAIAHLWFVTIHPFDSGNGVITRAITEMQLCRADQSSKRFYSMSSQINAERNDYYEILENTQKGGLDITNWLDWFLDCLDRSMIRSEDTLHSVLKKSQFWTEHAESSLNDRQRRMLNKLLDGIEEQLTSSKWATFTDSSQDTAGRDIKDLIKRGILRKENAGGRSTAYKLA